MRESTMKEVFDMFDGHCHFCGDEIVLEKRGFTADMDGHWEADHVVMKKNGGSDRLDNLLPACTRCNRLRWGRSGQSLRLVLVLGLVAKREAYYHRGSMIGETLRSMRIQTLADNWHRRMRAQLRKRGLSDKRFKTKDAQLRLRKVRLGKALSDFEDYAVEHRHNQKWDDVLARLRKKFRKAGTHGDWLRAEKALAE